MSEADDFLRRLDAVEDRLAGHAASAGDKNALTSADPGIGERWEAGQVWAHLAEFIPYWIDQLETVSSRYTDEPVPFGRTKNDAGRLAAIERDRSQPTTVLWSETHSGVESLRQFLRGIDGIALHARGLHPSRGVMTMSRMLDEFLVGHLEQHADQLDELARGG